MKVKDWKPFDSGNLKGYFRLITSEGFEIKGMKLLQGENGMFVGAPSQKGKDGKYYDQVWIPEAMKQKLLDKVLEIASPEEEEFPF
tara:strand:+ start:50 stop:307 length:258 start_codon:yes stop_codon:yes gene_type:complete